MSSMMTSKYDGKTGKLKPKKGGLKAPQKHLMPMKKEKFLRRLTFDDDDKEDELTYAFVETPFADLTNDVLRERIAMFEGMIETQRRTNEQYLHAQEVIISHLAETNEDLLHFFQDNAGISGDQ